jgi:hypothetical protein
MVAHGWDFTRQYDAVAKRLTALVRKCAVRGAYVAAPSSGTVRSAPRRRYAVARVRHIRGA